MYERMDNDIFAQYVYVVRQDRKVCGIFDIEVLANEFYDELLERSTNYRYSKYYTISKVKLNDKNMKNLNKTIIRDNRN